jgi:hypothetical protein
MPRHPLAIEHAAAPPLILPVGQARGAAMDIMAIAGFGYLAAIGVFVFGLLSSALHLVFAGIRVFNGRPSRLNWFIAARWLTVLGCAAWLGLVYSLGALVSWLQLEPAHIGTWIAVGLFVAFVPMVLIPVVLPLYEVYRYNRASSLALAITSVIAFPVVIAFTTLIVYSTATASHLIDPIPPETTGVIQPHYPDAALYALSSDQMDNKEIAKWLSLPDISSQQATPRQFEAQRAALWLEMSLNDISFEWFHDAGWHISKFDFNGRNTRLLTFLPWFFRFAFTALFWAVIWFTVRAAWRASFDYVRRHATDAGA